MKKIAVIDLGSNSVRMSIFDQAGRTLRAFRSTIRLSQGMSADLRLGAEAQARAVKALCEYKAIIDEEKVSDFCAVATAAVRKAKNQADFLELVRTAAKIDLRVIDGKQEAALDSLAVSRCLNIKEGLICDIGGGSTELIGISDRSDTPMVSIPYGSRGIYEKFFENGEDEAAKASAQMFADSLVAENRRLGDFGGKVLVGIGGTLRALAKLDLSDFGQKAIANYEITAENTVKLIKRIEAADMSERKLMAGIGERADIIIGGLVLLKAVLKATSPQKIAVADVGVREGVFFDLVEGRGIL